MASVFKGQPPQNKAFSNQNKGHLGYVYIYIDQGFFKKIAVQLTILEFNKNSTKSTTDNSFNQI